MYIIKNIMYFQSILFKILCIQYSRKIYDVHYFSALTTSKISSLLVLIIIKVKENIWISLGFYVIDARPIELTFNEIK